MQTIVLARLHETSDLLRRVARMQHLSKRLNSQMNSITQGPDIVKAANSLHELGIFLLFFLHLYYYINVTCKIYTIFICIMYIYVFICDIYMYRTINGRH